MIRQIVGRLHVSASNVDVIREVRNALKRSARTREHREMRHDIYRQALAEHKRNRRLYYAVMSGNFGAAPESI